MRSSLGAVLATLLVPVLLPAQYGYPRIPRTRGARPTANAGAYGGPAVTFHGKLKQISNKEVVIVSDEDQEIVLRRTHKTKFLKGDKEIKPADIPEGTALTLDVTKDPDMKPVALNVFVDQPKPKTAQSQPTSSSSASPPAGPAKESPK